LHIQVPQLPLLSLQQAQLMFETCLYNPTGLKYLVCLRLVKPKQAAAVPQAILSFPYFRSRPRNDARQPRCTATPPRVRAPIY
jgi:hypothetical protein